MKILGIESSCDETAAAIVEDGHQLLANVVHSQIDIHAQYGGVVPEIAARSHIEYINPVINQALTEANLGWNDIDAIAVTNSPGLSGSLLVGTLAARTLAIIHQKPLYGVHHILCLGGCAGHGWGAVRNHARSGAVPRAATAADPSDSAAQ